jgi:hypothetical protein
MSEIEYKYFILILFKKKVIITKESQRRGRIETTIIIKLK